MVLAPYYVHYIFMDRLIHVLNWYVGQLVRSYHDLVAVDFRTTDFVFLALADASSHLDLNN